MIEQDIAEGRRLLAEVTPGPYRLIHEHSHFGYGRPIFQIDPLRMLDGMERIEDARAVLWLLQHAEELLDAADYARTPEEWRR